ncbi:TOM1-like protein 2 [Meles meles]|uniref:TOM1-like protein 2 n=1 Tax=Meles meles TaxID=9662 RepID=UPI001E69B285|nr:TOM1-like protein 2 [Meles meles]
MPSGKDLNQEREMCKRVPGFPKLCSSHMGSTHPVSKPRQPGPSSAVDSGLVPIYLMASWVKDPTLSKSFSDDSSKWLVSEKEREGVEFPMADLDALSPIHTPQRSVPEVDPAAAMPRSQPQQRMSGSSHSSPPAPSSAPQAPALSVTGPITANSEQIARLRSELDVVRGNTKVMSEMLTEMVPGQEDSSDLELLQELNRTCRAMQQRIVELISRVSNEEVTEELLHVNDDLNNVFLRYERFERYRSGRSVQNASNGVLNEVTEDNLIDLGPGSPAVVSPMVGNTAPPSSLSSQLAGLDLGTESVSGTLSSLQRCKPGDGFDMFAQTRGNSLAEQRKTVTYEDPQAAGGLASASDSRKQSSEVAWAWLGQAWRRLRHP